MAKTNRFVGENLINSITSKIPEKLVLDYEHPFSFVRWVEYNKILFTDISDLLSRYKNYVNTWYLEKNRVPEIEEITVKDLYINLLNEIILNYTTLDERRFLKNIDPNNPRDLAIAVPFFAEKIKEVCLYYNTIRDKVASTTIEYNLKGSNFGLEKLIFNSISESLEAQDLIDIFKTLNLPVSTIRNNIVIELEENYDQYADYFDIGTLPASAYNSFDDLRARYFNLNTNEINPNIFIDFDKAIIEAIKSYPFYLIELGSNNFTINKQVNSSELNYLKDRDFINLVNDEIKENLSLNLQATETKKYMGVNYYYLSTGSTNTEFISGLLFDADSPFANYLNKNTPTIASVPSTEFLFSKKQLGLFFKPDKIGLLSFNNFNFTYALSSTTLSASTVYIFPDPELLGKVTGGTKQEQNSPLYFQDNSNSLKVSVYNSYKQGEIKNSPLLPTHRAYQSREQSLNYTNQGLCRYIDPQDFFEGAKKEKWANSDVYPLVPFTEFPIDSRIETLLPLNNKTLIQFKSDVYGNDYGLYKIIGPIKNLQDSQTALIEKRISKRNLIVDGYIFNDPVNGYNFNYSKDIPTSGFIYSGVTLKTTNNIPPGSGYYTQGSSLTAASPLSAQNYDQGLPSFILVTEPFFLKSYKLQPENFSSSYVVTDFNCNIRDGFTFVGPNSGLLVDTNSDNSSFDPYVTPVYYNILVEAGLAPAAPDLRPNFAFAPTFLYPTPLSAAQYDCSYFIVSSFSNSTEPCENVSINYDGLFLQNYFYNNISPTSDTQYDLTPMESTERKTIYETKFDSFGDFYFRSSNSSIIKPVSAALSAIFVKYSQQIQNEIFNKLINFDLYYDILQFETENYLIFDKIEFNYASNLIRSSSSNELYVRRGINNEFEKISTVWFNEKENNLIFATTTLSPLNSATNFKIIYPNIYIMDLNKPFITQIYPVNALTVDELQSFSLSGTGFNIDIASIDKPIMKYNSESGLYSLTFVARDTSDLAYINVITFKYINGVLSNIKNSFYKPNMDLIHTNFSNPSAFVAYNTFTVQGSSAGSITGGQFLFGS
jgi:hypothetical protein